jgi:predicted CXXCH cytochrome family protein
MLTLMRGQRTRHPRSASCFLIIATLVAAVGLALPVTASAATPHADYVESGDLCSVCHDPHEAYTARYLFTSIAGATGELGVCYSCHGGTGGADTDVWGLSVDATNAFSLASGHAVENTSNLSAADLTNVCSSCHTPHMDPADRRSLFASKVNSVTITAADNTWCYACHNDAQAWYTTNKYGSPYPPLSNPTRDATGYPIFGTFPGPTTYNNATRNAHDDIPASSGATTRVAGDCLYCHMSHRSNSAYDSLVATFQPSTASSYDRVNGDFAAACFVCHDGSWETTGAANIKRYVTFNGAQDTVNSGHRVKSSGGTLPQYSPLPCYECHNPHGSSRGNGHLISDALGASLDTTSAPGVRRFCFTCHTSSDNKVWDSTSTAYVAVDPAAKVVGLLRSGGTSGAGGTHNYLWLEVVSGHASGDTQSCYVCHGSTYGAASTSNNVHNPSPGLSTGGSACYSCHSVYMSPMEDASGTIVGATRGDFYHHVMGGNVTGTVVYQEGDYAPGATGAYPVSSTRGVFCVSCHVDHDKFNSKKAANLRSSSGGSFVATATDYTPGVAGGGLCIGCHMNPLPKNATGNVHSDGTTWTVAVFDIDFEVSSHQYEVTSTFNDGSIYTANCTKCHGGEDPKIYQTGAEFGVHWSSSRRLLSALGSTQTDPLRSVFCYRCHARVGDFTGAKTVAGRDIYGLKGETVAAANEYVWQAFKGASVVSSHPVDSKVICENCHSPHAVSAAYPVADPKATDYQALWSTKTDKASFCLGCHDGDPPVYNNVTAYVPATVTITLTGADKSGHADTSHWAENGSISAAEIVACGECHDNHGSTLPKLLGEFTGGVTATNTINGAGLGGNDNSVCFACHTGASALAASPSKTASGYPTDGTWPGKTTYTTAYNGSAHTGSIHTAVGMVWPGTSYPYGDCKNCHDVHGTASTYDELRTTDASGTYDYDQADFSFCFNCHGADGPSADNIKQYFPTSVGGSATQTSNTRFGHKTLSPGNLPAGSAMPCYDCHNPHGSSAAYGLQVVTQTGTNTTVTIGDSAGEIAMSPADQTTASNVRNFCFSCHTTYDTSSGWNGSAMAVVGGTAKASGISRTTYAVGGAHLRLPLANGHYLADTSRSCFTCHGDVHNPSPGLSDGGQACYGCHGAYQSPMEDNTGAKTGATRASFYHHVLGGAAGDGDIAPNAGTYPTSTTDVYCVSCHTDHNYFNNRQAGNLRSEITNSSGAATASTDFNMRDVITYAQQSTDATYYAAGTTSISGPWTNTTNANGAPNATVANSSVNNAFEATQSFTGFPADWENIDSASITVRSQAAGAWGGAISTPASQIRYPVSDLAYGSWATRFPTAPATNWDKIDDPAPGSAHDVDATYIVSNQNVAYQAGVSVPTVPANATNISVSIVWTIRDVATNAQTNTSRLWVNGTSYTAATTRNPGTTYVTYTDTWANNPNGNVAWTPATVNTINGVGVATSGASAMRVTQMYVQVDYSVPGTNDDQWSIGYSVNGGTSWASIVASSTASEAGLTDHTVSLTGILTPANAALFRVRILGAPVGAADNAGTINWDASTLSLRWRKTIIASTVRVWGICVSCHKVSLAKQGQGSDQAATGTANTPSIEGTGFANSSHNYAVSSTFGDATTFSANCSKCHSDEQAKEFQTSTYKFGTHWSASVGILRALGVFVGNPPKQEACYACHNATAAKYGETLSAEAKSTQGEFAMLSKHNLTKVTCANCHNVHEATVTAPAADPYNTYNAASLTTTAAINVYCLKCHDGTPPTQLSNDTTLVPWTVSANATANIGSFYSTDGHGTAAANVDCRKCHEQHGSTLVHLLTSPVDGQAVSSYTDTDDQAQCLACHRSGGIGSAANIARYYPTTAHGTATQADNPIWTRFGHRTKTAGTLAAGSAMPCRQCHNPHGGAGSGYMLAVRTQVAAGVDTLIGDLPGELWMSDTTQTPANTIYVRRFCFTCHTDSAGGYGWNGSIDAVVPSGSTVLGIDRVSAGAVLHLPTLPNGIKGHALADTTYSCYLCHGDDFTASNSVNVHNPASGESPGGIPCYTCHTVYQDRMEDGSGTAVGGGRTLTYHHVLGSGTHEGDTITYPTSADSKTDVYCLSCHVDHNLFSPFVNSSYLRSANLRVALGASAPSSASDATSTDFAPGGAYLTAANTSYATSYTDFSSNWTNDANVLGAPDSGVASSSTDNSFQLRSRFTFPSPLTAITAATLTVRSQAAGNWGAAPAASQIRYPVSDLAYGSWATRFPTAPATNWDKIDDPAPGSAHDVDATYIVSNQNVAYQAGVSVPTVPANATNISVSIVWTIRDVATNAQTNTSRLWVNGTSYTAATTRNPGTTYVTYTDTWANNPNGNVAWTPATVNTINGVGVATSGASAMRVTQMYVQVDYTVPNDDQWSIGYSVNGGTSWASIVASSTASEAGLTDHTVSLTGILTPANSPNFLVRVLGAPVGAADNSGTVGWDSSTLQLTYTYPNTAGNGICMTCHSLALDKDTTDQKYEANSSHTPTLSADAFGASAHTYDATSTFTDDSTFRADCSKCHDSEIDGGGMERGASTTGFQTSTYKFSVHYSAARRILGAMGVAVSDPPAEENVCYACHSTSSDGLKIVADHDWYNVIGMSTVSQGIFALIDGASAGPTTASNTLYLRPTADGIPSEPMPNAHQTGDTFQGGTWGGRLMAPGASAVAYETYNVATTNTTGQLNWRGVTFTSAPVTQTVTLGAGNWTINVWAREGSANQNAFVRYMIYKWDANDTIGTTIVAAGLDTAELPTTAAPGVLRTITVAGSTVTLDPGDKISVDLEIRTANATAAGTASFYYGSGAASTLVMPGSVRFAWTNPAGAAHMVASYSGIHRPSSQDETRGYITANRHVECADCHNVHETQPTRHTQNTNLVSGALKGVSGAAATFSGSNWTSPTAYSLITTATYEYQICFKCHSGFNQNTQAQGRTTLITWGGSGSASWTDQGLEFSTANQSYHPVVAALPPTDPSATYGSDVLSAGDMRVSFPGPDGATYGGWANGSVMYCSDCHAQSNAGSLGPHGSAVKWMLKGPNQAWPYLTAAANGTNATTGYRYAEGDEDVGLDTPDGLFCRNCHEIRANGAHGRGDHAVPCVNCHIRVPHGGKVSRLLRAGTDANVPARYAADGQGGWNGDGVLTGVIDHAAGTNYAESDCAQVGCGQHSGTITGAEVW